MKKIILLAGILAVAGSCKKKADHQPDKGPGEFYISFKTDDSTYDYKVDDKFTYVCGRALSSDLSSSITYRADASITPLPLNTDVYSIKLQFNYETECSGCYHDLEKFGNEIFNVGAKKLCKIDSMLLNRFCTGNDVVMVYFTDAAGKIWNSQTGDQPAGNHFYIDSVFDYRSRSANFNLLDYDKIIVGRFSCRVFDKENKTSYKDFKEGKFRMPAWRNY